MSIKMALLTQNPGFYKSDGTMDNAVMESSVTKVKDKYDKYLATLFAKMLN